MPIRPYMEPVPGPKPPPPIIPVVADLREHIPIGSDVELNEAIGEGAGGASSLTELTDVTGDAGYGKSPVDDGSNVFPLTRVTTKDDLETVLQAVAAVERHEIGATGEPGFQANWRNIGDPWAPACYRKLANSTVRLEGTVTCDDATIADATWIPVFTLPGDCAPGRNLEFSVLTNDNAISKVYVWEDGQVIWGGYAIGTHAPVGRLPLNTLSWSTSGPSQALHDAIGGLRQ